MTIAPVKTECDVLIIGGGPTGLTAGIYAAQARLKTILVDRHLPGGQVTNRPPGVQLSGV